MTSHRFDRWMVSSARALARRSSRRGFLGTFAGAITGAAVLPLLPLSREARAAVHPDSRVPPQSTGVEGDPGDPTTCEYWRYCAIDGFLCSCCGGTRNACPPGTEMSPLTWIGTCENPADGKRYIVSYNDCCGKSSCGRCLCNRNEGDTPIYRPQSNNDNNWCMGTKSTVYNCSTAVILGLSEAS